MGLSRERVLITRKKKISKFIKIKGKLKIKAAINAYICTYRDRLPTAVFLGFLCISAGKESACNAGDVGLMHGLRSSPGEGNGYPLQYSFTQ